jgi:hypothetical protein
MTASAVALTASTMLDDNGDIKVHSSLLTVVLHD